MDYFPEVEKQITNGMDRTTKINMLLRKEELSTIHKRLMERFVKNRPIAGPSLTIHFRIVYGHIEVSLANTSSVVAKSPRVVLDLPTELTQVGYELDGNTRLHTWTRSSQYKGKQGNFYIYSGNTNRVIHPGTEEPLLRIDKYYYGTMTKEHATITYEIAAEDTLPVGGEAQISLKDLS